MRARRCTTALFFVFASVINPALLSGCNALFPFEFGEPEVVALVDTVGSNGAYDFRGTEHDYELSVVLTQSRGVDQLSQLEPSSPSSPSSPFLPFAPMSSMLLRSAHACGQRTFLRSADACLDITRVPVEGAITVKSTEGEMVLDHVPVAGTLEVHGKQLKSARVDLKFGDDTIGLVSFDTKVFTLSYMRIKAVR